MKIKWDFTEDSYVSGSFFRDDFKGLNLYKQFAYKEISIDTSSEQKVYHDYLAEELYHGKLLEQDSFDRYGEAFQEYIGEMEGFSHSSNEEIYAQIKQIRVRFIGEGILKAYKKRLFTQNRDITKGKFQEVIRQEQIQDKILLEKTSILLAAVDMKYLPSLINDRNTFLKMGKKVFVLCREHANGADITEEDIRSLAEDTAIVMETSKGGCLDFSCLEGNCEVNTEEIFLIGYGEEPLFAAKNLKIPAFVKVIPEDLYAKAITNLFLAPSFAHIYIPPHFTIFPYVPIKERTCLNYSKLDELYREFGEVIYTLPWKELYERYPEYFIDIYGHGKFSEIFKFTGKQSDFLENRQHALEAYCGNYGNVQVISTYFTEDGDITNQIPWSNEDIKNGVLVNLVKTNRVKKAGVIFKEAGEESSPRQILEGGQSDTLKIISNFLFFTTEKVLELYNRYRKNRPYEQVPIQVEPLDYQYYQKKDGKEKTRIETFPLYKKGCIGLKTDGTFCFFHFKLGSGSVFLNEHRIVWNAEDVNSQTQGRVMVLTPLFSEKEVCENAFEYTKKVGFDRVNLIIINDKLTCVREGDVLLPSIGVVLSLEKEYGRALIKEMNLEPLRDQYYSPQSVKVRIRLQPPQRFGQEEWEQLTWAFGGGMTLIEDGLNYTEDSDKGAFAEHLKQEGWFTPLSMQTQESPIHQMIRFPRTAFGMTKQGDFFVLIFSGRTRLSKGADYEEMCSMAKRLLPDIDYMMNADGGASSVLGAVIEGRFVELSYPASTGTTCTGMSRNMNTLFYMELV